MDICTVCSGRLIEASYIADGYGNSCSKVSTNDKGKHVVLTIMICEDCGIVYARKQERDA